MKISSSPITRPTVSILAFALTGCLTGAAFLGAPTAALAQGTRPSVNVSATKTIKGDFRASNGHKGTFVNVVTVSNATRTDAVTLSDTATGETSTDSTTVATNADGSRVVDFSHTNFGDTGTFTSHKTVTREKHGNFVGTGTFTTAAGTSGALTTLETRVESINVVSAIYSDTTKGVSNDLRLEDSELGFAVLKSVDLDPSGNVSTLVITRYITSIE